MSPSRLSLACIASRAVMTISPASWSSDPSIRTLPANGDAWKRFLAYSSRSLARPAAVPVDRVDRDLHEVRELGRVQPFRGGREDLVHPLELVGPFGCERPCDHLRMLTRDPPRRERRQREGERLEPPRQAHGRVGRAMCHAASLSYRGRLRSGTRRSATPATGHAPDPEQPFGLELIQPATVPGQAIEPGREHRDRSNHASDNTERVRH